MTLDVLGTKYTVSRVKCGRDKYIDNNHLVGYCEYNSKRIVVLDMRSIPEWENNPDADIASAEAECLRHEIIHAFLHESGLGDNTFIKDEAWATNEEIVDWIAIQFPKILEAFRKAGCI